MSTTILCTTHTIQYHIAISNETIAPSHATTAVELFVSFLCLSSQWVCMFIELYSQSMFNIIEHFVCLFFLCVCSIEVHGRYYYCINTWLSQAFYFTNIISLSSLCDGYSHRRTLVNCQWSFVTSHKIPANSHTHKVMCKQGYAMHNTGILFHFTMNANSVSFSKHIVRLMFFFLVSKREKPAYSHMDKVYASKQASNRFNFEWTCGHIQSYYDDRSPLCIPKTYQSEQSISNIFPKLASCRSRNFKAK